MSGERGQPQLRPIITAAEVRQLVERYLNRCLRSGARPGAEAVTTCISKNCYYDRDDICLRFRALHDADLFAAQRLIAGALRAMGLAEGAEANERRRSR